ncbi:hypothetical protein B7R22_04700 [Subtercola boreus]|uniref:Barstar (barnase inhibitor) domain-containing protein n=2 Tax=Subtercola boreus TaxID=120213 RepID=A0A3E0W256_9MICO|nr:hypothetical protein B7R22_04700 [Subtercola boreus]
MVALFEAIRLRATPGSTITLDAAGPGFLVDPVRDDGRPPWLTVPPTASRSDVRVPPGARLYEIDGNRIDSWESFFTVVGEAVNGPGGYFGRGLDALYDCLRGGFGTPDDDFGFRWGSSATSRRALGYAEGRRLLRHRLQTGALVNRRYVREDLLAAEHDRGATPFDWIVEVFDDSGIPLELA